MNNKLLILSLAYNTLYILLQGRTDIEKTNEEMKIVNKAKEREVKDTWI